MLWFSLGASLDEEELLSNLATKVGKFGGSSWIGVVTPFVKQFLFSETILQRSPRSFLMVSGQLLIVSQCTVLIWWSFVNCT